MNLFKKIFLFLALACMVYACKSVAFTGRKQFLVYSDSQITSLSDESYSEFMSSAKISSDKSNSDMVQRVGKRMTQALETYLKSINQTDYLQGLKWDFNLVNSAEVNAFCMPNGKIVFYEGIMPFTNTEDFIAVVMGHEIAHAVARHGNERMSQQALVGTVGDVLSKMIEKNATAGKKALFDVAFGLGGQYGLLLPYSRKHEYEADRIGLIIMAIAGYDVEQAPLFWEKMSAGGKNSIPEFLSTHPSDKKRIDNLLKVIPEAKSYIAQ